MNTDEEKRMKPLNWRQVCMVAGPFDVLCRVKWSMLILASCTINIMREEEHGYPGANGGKIGKYLDTSKATVKGLHCVHLYFEEDGGENDVMA